MISKPEISSVRSVWQGFDRKSFPAQTTIFAEGEMGTPAYRRIALALAVGFLAGVSLRYGKWRMLRAKE